MRIELGWGLRDGRGGGVRRDAHSSFSDGAPGKASMSTTMILWYLRRAGERHIDQRTRTDAHEVDEYDFPAGGLGVRSPSSLAERL